MDGSVGNSSGHGRPVALMSSQKLWLPTHNQAVNTPARMGEGSAAPTLAE